LAPTIPITSDAFRAQVVNFWFALAGGRDRAGVLGPIRRDLKQEQKAFVGVISRINPTTETPEQARDPVLEPAKHIPMDQLGKADDCGFAPFSDEIPTSRDAAVAKMRAPVPGARPTAAVIGG
jgi:5-methyltetrahydropteroyltriglutamate--homocysteine methyltransferase